MRSLIICLLIATVLGFSNAKPVPDAEVLKTLFKNYDHNTRPIGSNTSAPDGGPVHVALQLYIRHAEFNDDSKELRTQLTVRQRWRDSRLVFSSRFNRTVELPAEVRIAGGNTAYTPWRPDLFLQNEKRSSQHSFGSEPNQLTIVGKDGTIMLSSRVSADFFCPNINAPRNKGVCNMDFASYGFTTDDIVYEWDSSSPLQFKGDIKEVVNNGYRYKDSSVESSTSVGPTGKYGSLRAKLTFERVEPKIDLTHPMMVHLYLATALLVLVSWVSFFLPKKELAARLLLILVPLLLIILIARYPLIKAPVVDYNRGEVTWFIWCLIFIFAALVQFLVMVILYGRELITATESQKNDAGYHCCPTGNLKSDVCDFVARILFPLAFVVFLIAYFSVYAA